MKKQLISVIIPVLNEEDQLRENLPETIKRAGDQELEFIVVDGGSEDNTIDIARSMGCEVISLERASRAIQMNEGVQCCNGEIIFFLHADTLPPQNYDQHIRSSLSNGSQFGMFAYKFEPSNLLLRINAYFTQFEGMFTGGGDQGLFITKKTFLEVGKFDEGLPMMEDFDFFERAKQIYNYEILPERMTVSSRKYQNNPYLKVQLVNLYTFISYKRGADLERLCRQYKRWIKT